MHKRNKALFNCNELIIFRNLLSYFAIEREREKKEKERERERRNFSSHKKVTRLYIVNEIRYNFY